MLQVLLRTRVGTQEPSCTHPCSLEYCSTLELCPKHILLPQQIHFLMALKSPKQHLASPGCSGASEAGKGYMCAGRCPAGAGDTSSLLVSPPCSSCPGPHPTGTCTPQQHRAELGARLLQSSSHLSPGCLQFVSPKVCHWEFPPEPQAQTGASCLCLAP